MTIQDIFINKVQQLQALDDTEQREEQEVVESKCCHDPNSQNSSLKRLSKICLVRPQVYDFFCGECKQVFRYTKHGAIYTELKKED